MGGNKLRNNRFRIFINKNQTSIALAVIGVFVLILLRSAFYGIATPDESFYLTIPFRLIKGDALIVDEWHASQFSAFLLYLPMKLFMLINKSTEGIILYFRCLFVLCQTAVSLFTFYRLKKYGTFTALISAVMYLLYVPETVNMLDYYTMSLMGFQVVMLVLFCTEKLKIPHLVFVGVVFACIVTAQPFNCIIYFIYSLAVIVNRFMKKKGFSEYREKYLNIKSWLYISIGIAAVAIVFLAFLFSRISPAEFFGNFKNVFGGSDHNLPFSEGESDMFSYAVIFETLFELTPISLIVSAVLLFALCIDKNRIKRRKMWICVLSAVTVIMVAEYCIKTFEYLIPMLFKPYVLFVFAVCCMLLTEKKDKNLIMILWTGIAYVIFLGMISQALDYIGVIGLVISNTALMPTVKLLYIEMKKEKTTAKTQKGTLAVAKGILGAVTVIAVAADITLGVAIKFIDDTTAVAMGRGESVSDTVIEKGPLKGIKTNRTGAQEYYDILSDIDEIKNNSCEQVLVAELIPWTYFCFDKAPATFTTWYIESELELYKEYYKNEEKIPECIYVPLTSFYWGGSNEEDVDYYKSFFAEMFSVEETMGKKGYIMYVNESKNP